MLAGRFQGLRAAQLLLAGGPGRRSTEREAPGGSRDTRVQGREPHRPVAVLSAAPHALAPPGKPLTAPGAPSAPVTLTVTKKRPCCPFVASSLGGDEHAGFVSSLSALGHKLLLWLGNICGWIDGKMDGKMDGRKEGEKKGKKIKKGKKEKEGSKRKD